MRKQDLIGILAIALVTGGMLLYRHLGVEPLRWGSVCIAADAPWPCQPRAWLMWMQHWGLWGIGAMLLGLWAFLAPGRSAPFAVRVAAVAAGIVAVMNYNATWGVLATTLGIWSWIEARSALSEAEAAEHQGSQAGHHHHDHGELRGA
ncbi:hypothetical protein IAI18_10065 [Acetobacteraceae bacterium H6797]|nr:hypothetical protein [Acetobacteraceae bacterium H6797]